MLPACLLHYNMYTTHPSKNPARPTPLLPPQTPCPATNHNSPHCSQPLQATGSSCTASRRHTAVALNSLTASTTPHIHKRPLRLHCCSRQHTLLQQPPAAATPRSNAVGRRACRLPAAGRRPTHAPFAPHPHIALPVVLPACSHKGLLYSGTTPHHLRVPPPPISLSVSQLRAPLQFGAPHWHSTLLSLSSSLNL